MTASTMPILAAIAGGLLTYLLIKWLWVSDSCYSIWLASAA